jgi:hypothetical protein
VWFKSKIVAVVTAMSLMMLPMAGCGLNICKFKPQVQAAEVTMGVLMDKFNIVYPAFQVVLAAAFGVNLPGSAAYAAFAQMALDKFSALYGQACPDEDTVATMADVLAQVEKAQSDLQAGLAKYYMEKSLKDYEGRSK